MWLALQLVAADTRLWQRLQATGGILLCVHFNRSHGRCAIAFYNWPFLIRMVLRSPHVNTNSWSGPLILTAGSPCMSTLLSIYPSY